MKAIDELRRLPNFGTVLIDGEETDLTETMVCVTRAQLNAISDAIERELEEGYVELPKDANDEVFRVGCEVKPVKRNTELAYTVYGMTYGKDGWKIYVSGDRHAIEREPSFFEVCEPHTVEDVLREFFDEYDSVSGYAPDENEVLAKFAECLQLRGENDG